MANESIATIDRNSYEPAYAQLVRILLGQIAAGEFRPGDRLPSEAQLCERYGVSPMTVRRVINILADQSVVIADCSSFFVTKASPQSGFWRRTSHRPPSGRPAS